MVELYRQGNRITLRKTSLSTTLSTTNPTWIDPDANPDLRGERPATKRLSHGTALSPGLKQSSNPVLRRVVPSSKRSYQSM
jgi:hypothetical protein